MNRRTLTTMSLLGLAVLFATAFPQVGFSQINAFVGTWKLNPTKSKFAGPAPDHNTLIIEAVGQGFRTIEESVDRQGNPIKMDYGVNQFDEKSIPVTGASTFDAVSGKRINDTTVEYIRTKAGKVVATIIGVISADGKTQTYTLTGVTPNGQPVNIVAVYDKQ